MKLITVYDRKGCVPVLSACYPNKDVFIRQLLASAGDRDLIYNQFPEDYVLIESSVVVSGDSFSFNVESVSDFTTFIKKGVDNDVEKSS